MIPRRDHSLQFAVTKRHCATVRDIILQRRCSATRWRYVVILYGTRGYIVIRFVWPRCCFERLGSPEAIQHGKGQRANLV